MFNRKYLSYILVFSLFSFLISCGGGGSATNINNGTGGSQNNTPNDSSADPVSKSVSSTEASRFLQQASFGANKKEIEKVSKDGFEYWLDDQLKKSATYMYPEMSQKEELEWSAHINQWWKNAIKGHDQLRQRVAFALSEIIVVSDSEALSGEKLGMANFYDVLIKNAFGNFRTLMEEVTLHPVMGEYLSMQGNEKPNLEKNIRPDENYARELMQLFTIGLVELNNDGTPVLDVDGNTIPSYTQENVEAFAHVFTGWNFAKADNWKWPEENYVEPMEAWEEYHDTSSQILLNQVVLAEGANAKESLHIALDNIFQHKNVGPFICKQLIQRLITSNPSSAYVGRVATIFNDNGSGVRGDLASVVKAIYLDDEARNGHLSEPTKFGKVKEPLLRVTQLWRAFDASATNGKYEYASPQSDLSQAPLRASSVFNFFFPDYSYPGEVKESKLVSPELQIHDETSIITMTNRLYANIYWRMKNHTEFKDHYILIDIEEEKKLAADPDALIEHLNLLLMGGGMSSELKADVKEMIEYHKEDKTHNRVAEAIFIIMSSPEGAIQK